MKPGMTMSPEASTVRAPSALRFGPTAAILSSSTSTSAFGSSPMAGSWLSTIPPLMRSRSVIDRTLAAAVAWSLFAVRSRLALLAQVSGEAGEVGIGPDRRLGGPDRFEVHGGLRHRRARLGRQLVDEAEVFLGQGQREGHRRGLGVDERGPLVL